MYPARVMWGLLAALAVISLTTAGPPSASSTQSLTPSDSSPAVDWLQPLGAESPASADAVSVDETGVYVVGMVQGALPGQTTSGSPYGYHAYIRKYSHAGHEIWTRQLEMEDDEYGRASAVHASGVYVAGSIRGELLEGGPPGFSDAFVRLYDRDGNEVWTRRLGLPGGALDGTSAYGIHAGGTGVYVAGRYPDGAFLRKLTHDGEDLWQVELSAFNAWATSVSANESGVYIAGTTGAALTGQESAGDGDIFIAAYSHEGNELWIHQFGSAALDVGTGVYADESGVYLSGWAGGYLFGTTGITPTTAFLRKYDLNGGELWIHQFGFEQQAAAEGVAVDATGVYVTGWTGGAFPGQPYAGGHDVFVRKFDHDGNDLLMLQFGDELDEEALGISASSSGLYVVGYLFDLVGNSRADGFVARIAEGAEPQTPDPRPDGPDRLPAGGGPAPGTGPGGTPAVMRAAVLLIAAGTVIAAIAAVRRMRQLDH